MAANTLMSMGSSLYLDDFGKITLTEQVSEKKFVKTKFDVSEVSHFSQKEPGMFRNGNIEFHFKSGKPSKLVVIPAGQKALFRELVNELDAQISKSVTKSKPSLLTPKSALDRGVAGTKRGKEVKPPRASGNEEFVAIDIEWADGSDQTSICEIGLAVFKNGKLKETFRSYVQPPQEFQLGRRELQTHGINESLILRAETLASIWPTLIGFVSGRPWVLHNATSDINRILATLLESQVSDIPDFEYYDTMLISRKIPWVESKSGLEQLADLYSLPRQFATYDARPDYSRNPHGALEDATLTGLVLLEMMKTCGFTNPRAFTAAIEAHPGAVRGGIVENGFSAPGKLRYSSPAELPDEAEVLKKLEKSENQAAKVQEKRNLGEIARSEFLANPKWSNMKVSSGQTVCFTQLMPWDDNGNDHKSLVEKTALKKGLKLINSVRSDLDLLVVNDPWVSESAKLRDALGRRNPIPVTLYSVFQKNNPDFPVWTYEKSEEYSEIRSAGMWPQP